MKTARIFYHHLLILLLATLIITTGYSQSSAPNTITFIQGDHIQTIQKAVDTVTLSNAPFSMRFYCHQYKPKKHHLYAARVTVLDDPKDIVFAKTGAKAEDVPYYGPGTGMAPEETGIYNTIMINNAANHYIMYANEDDKRANLISKQGKWLELEWPITNIYRNLNTTPLTENTITPVYFVVYIDNNQNEVIDVNELHIIIVQFR